LQTLDPEGIAMREAKRLVSFRDKEVLEVGCGSGRLTFLYAPVAKKVAAIDPLAKAISEARGKVPKELASKVSFRVGRGEELVFPNQAFDLVFFSWSLCCTDVPAQGRALTEAWRVLRPKGILLSVQESLHQPFYVGMITYLMKRGSGQPDWTEAERQARLALRYACFVERRFDFVAEKELSIYGYYGTVREALRRIAGEGPRVNSLEFTYLYPMNVGEVTRILKSCASLLDVEANYTAQLAGLVRRETGVEMTRRFLKYNGEPIYPSEVVDAVHQALAKEAPALV
jgi:ubiquinone/menaquinone biosynthesis C-methylase UbiE